GGQPRCPGSAVTPAGRRQNPSTHRPPRPRSTLPPKSPPAATAALSPLALRSTPRDRSVREDVLLRPALKVKQGACRQEVEAGPRQLGASFARQHRVEPRPQRVQVQDVRGGITQLLLGQ